APEFFPSDAKYLEWSLLVADLRTAWGFDELPERERAIAAFDWVVRQTRLETTRVDDFQKREPRRTGYFPQQLLARGFGPLDPRDLFFRAVLEQLGTPGCKIMWRNDKGRQGFLGAFFDDQIYLFDSVRGVPLPGAKGPATLAELFAHPE